MTPPLQQDEGAFVVPPAFATLGAQNSVLHSMNGLSLALTGEPGTPYEQNYFNSASLRGQLAL